MRWKWVKDVVADFVLVFVVVVVGVWLKAPRWATVFMILAGLYANLLRREIARRTDVYRVWCEMIGHAPAEMKRYDDGARCLRCGDWCLSKPPEADLNRAVVVEETLRSRLERIAVKLGIEGEVEPTLGDKL